MDKEGLKIYEGKTEAFLVWDKSLGNIKDVFYEWLRDEGFSFAGNDGGYGCPWIYINITRKQYAYGKPGIELVRAIGNHALTMDEFKMIYSIYKKYQGKRIFDFDL